MYTVVHSTDPAAMVLLFSGRDTTDSEYEGVVRAWERLYRDAKGQPAVGLVIVPVGHAQPSAHWRRRLAEVHDRETAPMQVVVVTESALIRGVVTAVNWLIRRRPNYQSCAVDNVDAAAEKLRSVEGMSKDKLRALLGSAQEAMRERNRAPGTIGAAGP